MKNNIFIIVLLLIFISGIQQVSATGNVSLSFDNASGQNGSQVVVSVRVANFSNMISMQGTIEFNPDIVSFYAVEQFGLTGLTATNFGTSQAANGKLAFSWYDQNLTGISKTDNSVVFALVFQVTGSAGQVSALNFTSSVTALEFVNTSYTPLQYDLSGGNITVTSSSNPSNFTIKMDSISSAMGTQILIPVRVANFNNITSIQGTIEFNIADVSFVSIEQFGLTGMDNTSFGTSQVSGGKFSFAWSDPSVTGLSKPDNSIIFALRLNVVATTAHISSVNFTHSITPLEFTNNTFTILPYTATAGKINILNTSSQMLTFLIDSVSAVSGTQVVVPVRVKRFSNIISIQGTIGFESTKATFASIEQFGLTGMDVGSFGTTQSANGVITFVWYDNGLTGQTLADSAIIFAIRFTVTGVDGQSLNISWLQSPTPVEAVNASFNPITTEQQNGKIEITNTGIGFAVNGTVTYFKTAVTPMNNVTMKLMSGTTVVATTTTNASGNYSFSNIPNGTYTMAITTTYIWGGVTATDALKIKRHVAGLELFTEPIRISAADVNNSGFITATDALKISRRVANLDTSFTKPDWIIEKPGTGGNTITVNNVNLTQNFYMLCTGDVNSSHVP